MHSGVYLVGLLKCFIRQMIMRRFLSPERNVYSSTEIKNSFPCDTTAMLPSVCQSVWINKVPLGWRTGFPLSVGVGVHAKVSCTHVIHQTATYPSYWKDKECYQGMGKLKVQQTTVQSSVFTQWTHHVTLGLPPPASLKLQYSKFMANH